MLPLFQIMNTDSSYLDYIQMPNTKETALERADF